jgi:hypothetical protein
MNSAEHQEFLDMMETYHAVLDNPDHPLFDNRHPQHAAKISAFNELEKKLTEFSANMTKKVFRSQKSEAEILIKNSI